MRWLVTMVFLAACVSHTQKAPLTAGYPVQELDKQEIYSDGQLIGYLRELEIQHPAAPVRFYRVETAAGGWVGNVDTQGRCYKSEPFVQEPRDLGVFPMPQGLALLFELDTPVQVVAMRGPGRGKAIEASKGARK